MYLSHSEYCPHPRASGQSIFREPHVCNCTGEGDLMGVPERPVLAGPIAHGPGTVTCARLMTAL